MTTTVPQNIKGTNIMGSHTPTRSSLRHSRMLVVNKNYQGELYMRITQMNFAVAGAALVLFDVHVNFCMENTFGSILNGWGKGRLML